MRGQGRDTTFIGIRRNCQSAIQRRPCVSVPPGDVCRADAAGRREGATYVEIAAGQDHCLYATVTDACTQGGPMGTIPFGDRIYGNGGSVGVAGSQEPTADKKVRPRNCERVN